MRISVSIFTPNAFSMRRAISPERSALAFSKLDRAGRETLSAAAAGGHREARRRDDLRTDKIAGMGRILHGHGVYSSLLLVIIFEIQIADFLLCGVDAEC